MRAGEFAMDEGVTFPRELHPTSFTDGFLDWIDTHAISGSRADGLRRLRPRVRYRV